MRLSRYSKSQLVSTMGYQLGKL